MYFSYFSRICSINMQALRIAVMPLFLYYSKGRAPFLSVAPVLSETSEVFQEYLLE